MLSLLHMLEDLKILLINSKKFRISEPCILCSNNKFLPLISLKQKPDSKISICINCGIAKIIPLPLLEDYEDYYQHQYNLNNGIKTFSVIPSGRGYSIHNFIKNNFDQINGIFEIGCGVGGNLLAFKNLKKGIALAGIEPSNIAFKIAKKNKINVIHGYSGNLTKEILKNYNFIIISHVLEHFLNPFKDLLKLAKITSPGTFFYIETPDSEFPNYKLGLKDYWFRITHIYYFNKYNLDALIKKCGLTILKFERFNHSLRYLLRNDQNFKKLNFKVIKSGRKQLLRYKICVIKSLLYSIVKMKKRVEIFLKKAD